MGSHFRGCREEGGRGLFLDRQSMNCELTIVKPRKDCTALGLFLPSWKERLLVKFSYREIHLYLQINQLQSIAQCGST